MKIAIGMKVMVTQNIETDLDITNGAQGTITGGVLHPDGVLMNHQLAMKP
jgi:hypothetical protein